MPYFNPATGRFDLNFDLGFDSSQFANELVDGADISEAEKAALQAVLARPQVVSKLRNTVALRSEAQRAMDRARNAATEAEQLRDQNFEWARDRRDVIEQWAASQQGHRPGATITAPTGEQLTRADVEQLLNETRKQFADTLAAQDESYVGLLADTVELTGDYSRRFGGESLPYADLQRFALEKRMTLRNAYDKFIEPKLDEKRKTDMAAAIAAAREEGRLEALSNREDPTVADEGGDITNAFKSVLLGRTGPALKDAGGQQLSDEDRFVSSWQAARGFTKERAH